MYVLGLGLVYDDYHLLPTLVWIRISALNLYLPNLRMNKNDDSLEGKYESVRE